MRPPKQIPAGWSGSKPPAALCSACRWIQPRSCPICSGAGQAVNTAAGLALLRDVAAHPWNRPIVVFFSGADGVQFLGTRNMFLAPGDPPAVWREEMTTLDQQIADTNRDLARARDVSDAPQNLSIVHDRPLLVRIGQILDADIGVQQDQLYRARSVAITTPSVDTTQTEARLEAAAGAIESPEIRFSTKSNVAGRSVDC